VEKREASSPGEGNRGFTEESYHEGRFNSSTGTRDDSRWRLRGKLERGERLSPRRKEVEIEHGTLAGKERNLIAGDQGKRDLLRERRPLFANRREGE